MTKEQIKIDVQKQTRLDELYSFWKDPRERFNNIEINKMKKNNCLSYLLVILVIAILFFLIKTLKFSF
jgi:hypothetical protein